MGLVGEEALMGASDQARVLAPEARLTEGLGEEPPLVAEAAVGEEAYLAQGASALEVARDPVVGSSASLEK